MSHAPRSVNSTVFPARFEAMEEPRRAAKIICPPEEILLPVPGAVISGAREWTSIALHGQGKPDLPHRFPPFEEGAPRHDPLGILFSKLDMEQFQQCFMIRVARLLEALEGGVASDGETPRRSFDKVEGKSNEITGELRRAAIRDDPGTAAIGQA